MGVMSIRLLIMALLAIFGEVKLFAVGAMQQIATGLAQIAYAAYLAQVQQIRNNEIIADVIVLIIAVIAIIVKRKNIGIIIALTVFICIIIDLIAQYYIGQL
jgi:hypothetical protein